MFPPSTYPDPTEEIRCVAIATRRTEMDARIHRPVQVRRQATAVGETGPTRRVWRGDGPRRELPEQLQDLSRLAVESGGGGASTLYQFLVDSHSDGMIVLHRGAVVYEQYLHGLRRQDLHLTASMAKAFIGLLAGCSRTRACSRGTIRSPHTSRVGGNGVR